MRRGFRVGFCAAAALGLALACAASQSEGWERAALARGAAAVVPFKQRLLSELTVALQQGPAHAIDVCSARAPQLALESASPGIRLGRTSHKLRNPGNAPPRWAEPLLVRYVSGEEQGPRVVRLGAGRVGYVEPIFTQPVCLTCHGEAIEPGLADQLRARYPQDRSIGFRIGELRGLAWAELEAER